MPIVEANMQLQRDGGTMTKEYSAPQKCTFSFGGDYIPGSALSKKHATAPPTNIAVDSSAVSISSNKGLPVCIAPGLFLR